MSVINNARVKAVKTANKKSNLLFHNRLTFFRSDQFTNYMSRYLMCYVFPNRGNSSNMWHFKALKQTVLKAFEIL